MRCESRIDKEMKNESFNKFIQGLFSGTCFTGNQKVLLRIRKIIQERKSAELIALLGGLSYEII